MMSRSLMTQTSEEPTSGTGEEFFRQLVENAADGIIAVSCGVLEYVNPRFARITGYEAAELVGQYLAKVVAPGSLEVIEQRDRDAILGRKSASEYRIGVLRRNGCEVPVEASAGFIEVGGAMMEVVILREADNRER